MLEIVLGDYRKHIEECICARDSLREETIECINNYINETFVYVLETEPHRGWINHMCN